MRVGNPLVAFARTPTVASRSRGPLGAAGALLAGLALTAPARGAEPPTFEKDVRPILARRCTVCHNAKKVADLDVSGGLALDAYEHALKGTKQHAVVVPGRPAESELVRRLVANDDDTRMPLGDKPLSESERALIGRWIEAGAPRGVPVAEPPRAVRPVSRRIVRSLDVTIPIETTVPGGTAGFGPGGALSVALRVAPLPSVTALAFRRDGRLLAVGSHGAVVIWDLADGRPARTLTRLPGPVHALAFSPDGKRLAVGAGLPAQTGAVQIYAVPGGTLLHEFEGHTDVVFALAFRPDGAQLASASLDQTVRLWNLAVNRPDGVFRGHSDFVYDLAYTADGHSLLTAAKDRSIKQIDVKSAREIRTYSEHEDDVLAVAIHPRQPRFVTTGNEPALRWWKTGDEKSASQQGGHSGPVHQLAFSADGRRLISASADGSVRIWDGQNGAHLRALAGATDWQYAAALTADGRLAAAGGWNGLVRVWDTESGKLLATLIQPPRDDPDQVDWLAIAPSGYVSCSAPLARLMRWNVAGTEVPADRLLAVFGRPDEVAHALTGRPVAAVTFPR
jgi:WD40 repeat protein